MHKSIVPCGRSARVTKFNQNMPMHSGYSMDEETDLEVLSDVKMDRTTTS